MRIGLTVARINCRAAQPQCAVLAGLAPSQRQSPKQRHLDLLYLGFGKPAELPFQLGGGDALNLLQMEGAGPQEGLWQIQFSPVAAQGSRMEENRHKVQLVVSRFPRE
jgi:hypothetical protein